MALLALWPEPTRVHVVFGVAAAADHGGLDHVLRLDVTFGATGMRVRTGERKARTRRMIEDPELPAIGRVAGGAVGSQRALVDILPGVTAFAAPRCLVETLIGVTLAAGDRHVQTEKRIGRQVMVERHVAPLRDRVAGVASLAERTAVRVGGAVAARAVLTEFLLLHHSGVAHVATELGVGTLEWKVLLVIVGRDPPRLGGMAVAASRTHAAGMTIIRFVTTGAGAWDGIVDVAAAMAVGAADVGMAAEKREAGFTAVLEFLRAPVRRGVTVAAILSLAALVDVVGQVTADALPG